MYVLQLIISEEAVLNLIFNNHKQIASNFNHQ